MSLDEKILSLGLIIKYENEIAIIKGYFEEIEKNIQIGSLFYIKNNDYYHYGIIFDYYSSSILEENINYNSSYSNEIDFPEKKYLIKQFFKGIILSDHLDSFIYKEAIIINRLNMDLLFNKNFIKRIICSNKFINIESTFANLINIYLSKNIEFIKKFLLLIFHESDRNYDLVKIISKKIL